ncbi:MAG TPA: SDR family oxidoreductase [Micromonosporaceae bacterium]
MQITIFGANGPTGRLLTRRAVEAGHHVTAVTRNPDTFPINRAGVTVVGADAYDADAVSRAVRGSDAVLSTLGVPFSRRPITVYSQGTANIVEAMHAHGVKRLVVVSSSATEPHVHADGGFLLNRVLQPLIVATIGKTTYADMSRMETLLRDSDLAWTVMRPSGLFDVPEATAYRLDENAAPGVYTARVDLAASMLDQLTDDRFVGRIAAVTTTAVKPTLWSLIRTEAMKNQR